MIKIITIGVLFLFLLVDLSLARQKTYERYDTQTLRVCADPNNLPYSNDRLEGFENQLAELLAQKLELQGVEYTWYPTAGVGFLRETLKRYRCDLVMATTLKNEELLNTNTYYRTGYAMVYRKDESLEINRLTDSKLQYLRLGMKDSVPPLTVLVETGLNYDIKYYRLRVDTRHNNMNERIIDDVLNEAIDVAILWGPVAGYYIKKYPDKLKMVVLKDEYAGHKITFRISMGVRQGEADFKRTINKVLRRNRNEIKQILLDYGVPVL